MRDNGLRQWSLLLELFILSDRRIIIITCLFLAAGAVLIARLAQIQLGWRPAGGHTDYTEPRGDRLLDTTRGGIFTRTGVPLARDEMAFDISVHYERLEDDDWKLKVSRLCDVPASDIQAEVDRIIARVERIWKVVRANTDQPHLVIVEQQQYHPVVKDVSAEAAAAIRTHPEQFPGVKAIHRTERHHPHGDLAPHIVGRVGSLSREKWKSLKESGRTWNTSMPMSEIGERYTQDDRIGTSGVERQYEDLLRGRRGYAESRLVFKTLQVERKHSTTPPEPGHDIYLTLRQSFQEAANEALEWAASQPDTDFERGAIVMLDVWDGSILAAATYPSYDLENFGEDFTQLSENPHSPLLFRPTQAALPPGSVYKLITALAGLEEQKISSATTFDCNGYKVVGGRRFHCVARWGHGRLNMLQAIEESCNVYMFDVAERVGGKRLAEWGRQFGLGRPTGIDLPYERSGQVPTPPTLSGTYNLAIGQGRILSTPLQTARATAALATGKLVQPHVLHHAEDRDGNTVKTYQPEIERLDIKEENLRAVRRGMRRVVRTGTAAESGMDQFRAAAKTGTAELTKEINHAWFSGYAPYGDPKVAFSIVSERTGGHGGSHAAPILARALEKVWSQIEKQN